MCELNLNKSKQESALKVEQSVLGTPQFYPQIRALLLGVGASPSRPDSQGSCKPQTGTKRGLDSLWSCCPLETQPVEYWGLRILRLSLCFLSGDSGQWGVCVRGVEGARFLPDGSSMSGAGGLKGKGTA